MQRESGAAANRWTYEIERLHGRPIIEGTMMRSLGIVAKTTRGDAMFPTVLRIPEWVPREQRADPRANYYLYFAAHHGTCISLAWAETVDSPGWTVFNVADRQAEGVAVSVPGRGVFDLDLGDAKAEMDFGNGAILRGHVSSPEVLVDRENQRFVMAMHGGSVEGQRSFVTTSRWGLNYNLPEEGGEPGHGPRPFVLNASSYMRLFQHRTGLYALGHSGYLSRPRDQQRPWALPPGHDPAISAWEMLEPSPFVVALEQEWERPLDGSVNAMRHCAVRLLDEGNTLEVFYSRASDEPERILRATVDVSAEDWTEWAVQGTPETLLNAEEPWEGECLHDAGIFEDVDGQLYLFYSCQAEDAIAVAKLTPAR